MNSNASFNKSLCTSPSADGWFWCRFSQLRSQDLSPQPDVVIYGWANECVICIMQNKYKAGSKALYKELSSII